MFLRLIHRFYRINTAATRWFRRRLTPAGYFVLVGLALSLCLLAASPAPRALTPTPR